MLIWFYTFPLWYVCVWICVSSGDPCPKPALLYTVRKGRACREGRWERSCAQGIPPLGCPFSPLSQAHSFSRSMGLSSFPSNKWSVSMGFPRQEYWSGLLFLSSGDLPDPGIKPESPALQADSLPWTTYVRFWQSHINALIYAFIY